MELLVRTLAVGYSSGTVLEQHSHDSALDVGYESVSAFIAAFSSALGTTPGRYYKTTESSRSRRPRTRAKAARTSTI
jgi:methylphosphotriester-DNA--protein-cysteine methyltransferase